MYGTDYKREIDIFRVSKSVKLVAGLITLLLIVATITLYAIRRKLRRPESSVALSIMDCLILFIGGGNLRMDHRFERWFFGIMLVGAFFIVSVFGGDLVDSVARVLNSKVETYKELTEINPQIYLDQILATYYEDIDLMLRLFFDTE